MTQLWIGRPEFDHRQRLGFLIFAASYPMVLWALSPEGTRLDRESDHSPPSNAEVIEHVGLYLHPHVFMAWYLVKHRDNFTTQWLAGSNKAEEYGHRLSTFLCVVL
jgi:hypothetical protein